MKIVVVGGVAGGMSAAARARRLDEQAEIVVLERGEHVSFANCGLPYYVSGEIQDRAKLLVQTPESLKAALDLDVRVRHEVTAVDPEAKTVTVQTPGGSLSLDYDALVLSPGASALRPPLPGLDSPRVRTLRTVEDALDMRETVEAGARHAVVLGGGFIGLEAAEALNMQGLEVTVVELAEHVLPPLEAEVAYPVTCELRRLGITVRSGVAAESVEPGDAQDTVVLADGSRLPADLVVLSVGVRPDTKIYEDAGIACERGAIVVDDHGRTSVPGIWAVGDAVLSTDAATGVKRPVALAGPANRAGRQVADDILRPESARPIPAAVGTAIVRVGELTAAMTGANRASLASAGIEHHTMHLHPNNHAGYFPGATQVHLLVHFDDDGRLLGAQVTGQEGVDKRIDVLATAIRAGMTVGDLIDLDLAYAPPYGSAKDPLNFAGMLGSNVLDRTVPLWFADDLEQRLQDSLVLDVRQPGELEVERIPGALNIPHTELRDRLDEVRQAAGDKPVRVLCRSGVRSAIAHRVLAQAGFDSASLSGGMLTLLDTLGDRAPEVLEMNQ
ncbi:pyridine nucleotide-disulfide oxidoreductase [Kocuria soli]|uniref:Pyridine nucleotide-disulfide oxidoreductase n=1 Tax=Kocuria soli TaxID=2485125 RepID=A0A3N3ZYU9_9MICC|nr:FAD-dependent oxidoreductase [Kocuria soli]ROZ64033.1 pyridine nucleotide-disulfide oxidoreductase [Kocuria soli]